MAFKTTHLELAELIVQAVNLDMDPSEIDPDTPLYGEGLGLDSIDILEIAMTVSKKYGFHFRSDDEDNSRNFTSVRALTEAIDAKRTK